MISENGKKVIDYLKQVRGQNVTKDDVAMAVGLTDKQVTGIFNSFVKKQYGVREAGSIDVNGEAKNVSFLKLTDLGYEVDVNSEEA